MERLINRRQQGDVGELSAMEWLTRQGATVFAPVGHSPDVDLIAMVDARPIKVQVKTSACRQSTPNGHERWSVTIATNGGNQSWTGTTKLFDLAKVDFLFVLVGDGRRWFIPAVNVESTGGLSLGGEKYSEFEIGSADEILSLVFGGEATPSNIGGPDPGERRSGRAGPDCKFGASLLSEFESHLPHESFTSDVTSERQFGRAGQSILREKRQITMPARPMDEAELRAGDRLRWRADGPGRLVIERIEEGPNLFELDPPDRKAG